MRKSAKLYIGSVLSVGAAVLLASIAVSPRLTHPARFVQCLVLAILASTFKVRFPGMQSSISLNFVLFLVGIGTLSLSENVIIAASAIVVQSLWRPRTRPKAIQVLFNVAALSISVFAADVLTAEFRSGAAFVPSLVIAGLVFFILNTWLVSFVLAFLNAASPLETWRSCHRWSFPYYMAGAALAVIVSAYANTGAWTVAVAMLPIICLLHTYYERYVKTQTQLTEATR